MRRVPADNRLVNSLDRAEAHARELQDILSLSPSSLGLAFKKALLVRLEIQYSISFLRLGLGVRCQPAKSAEKTIDLGRAVVRLSSHISKAMELCNEGDYAGCTSELYAADAISAKIIPKLRKEQKG